MHPCLKAFEAARAHLEQKYEALLEDSEQCTTRGIVTRGMLSADLVELDNNAEANIVESLDTEDEEDIPLAIGVKRRVEGMY